MKKYQTDKMYMGFPVYIVSTLDDEQNILVSTMSSSYSLGDKFVMGMWNQGNTANHIKVGDVIAVNYLFDYQGLYADLAGRTSGKSNSLKHLELTTNYDFYNEKTPYLIDAMIVILGKVENIIDAGTYLHLFLDIEDRLVHEDILDEKGNIIYTDINPLLYLGDERRRGYKKTTTDIVYSGGYLKQNRKKE